MAELTFSKSGANLSFLERKYKGVLILFILIPPIDLLCFYLLSWWESNVYLSSFGIWNPVEGTGSSCKIIFSYA